MAKTKPIISGKARQKMIKEIHQKRKVKKAAKINDPDFELEKAPPPEMVAKPNKREPKPIVRRRCPRCNCWISRYNNGTYCHACASALDKLEIRP